ncbi:hypothetical protein C8A00DRAFT_11035 [Chaetomidium leptoderma]|uniref:Fe2OG dioxygenase domain-containing protein n=1 Tax=Chaetomidium leptoderma TaxID=669021 RepID=A0AAN6VVF7_9PEZI|nr:hypothetical protein C8A00DRAFT_11035 [Chaetomidium leptoderma]
MPLSFDAIPPFPDNLPLAPIAIISYQKLLNGDHDEAGRVLEAAKTYGFFYLDLQDTAQGETLLTESEQLHALARNAFALPLHEKLQYALQRGVSLFGYKPAGTVKATDRDQRPDTTEFLNISKDHLHNIHTPTTRSYPPQVDAHKPLLQSFTRHSHDCGMLVLRTLASQLNLPPDTFTSLNLFDHPSGDHCRLTHTTTTPHSSETTTTTTTTATTNSSSSPIGLASHTDFGSVTLLFNWQGGLQIESPPQLTQEGGGKPDREWEWVKPLPGHAIINLGDAMVTFTNGTLKSAKHRVVPSSPAAAQGTAAPEDRYSVVYFVRPHNSVLMKPLPGEYDSEAAVKVGGKFSARPPLGENQVLTAEEWMRQRAVQLGN